MIITINSNDRNIDIKVNEKLKVKDAFNILNECGFVNQSGQLIVKTYRDKREVSFDESFEKNEILNGDILEIRE